MKSRLIPRRRIRENFLSTKKISFCYYRDFPLFLLEVNIQNVTCHLTHHAHINRAENQSQKLRFTAQKWITKASRLVTRRELMKIIKIPNFPITSIHYPQKCRSRMKQSREDTFASARNIQIERKVSFHFLLTYFSPAHIKLSLQKSSLQQLINRIVQEELSVELERDIELQDIILREILDNFDQWQSEEYEKEQQHMIIDLNDNEGVVCPVCEYNALSLSENIISCNCGLR